MESSAQSCHAKMLVQLRVPEKDCFYDFLWNKEDGDPYLKPDVKCLSPGLQNFIKY